MALFNGDNKLRHKVRRDWADKTRDELLDTIDNLQKQLTATTGQRDSFKEHTEVLRELREKDAAEYKRRYETDTSILITERDTWQRAARKYEMEAARVHILKEDIEKLEDQRDILIATLDRIE